MLLLGDLFRWVLLWVVILFVGLVDCYLICSILLAFGYGLVVVLLLLFCMFVVCDGVLICGFYYRGNFVDCLFYIDCEFFDCVPACLLWLFAAFWGC